MDGLRKCLIKEYSHLYVLNLRGNQRTSGEESRREGGKIFGSSSRAPIAITILVKDPAQTGPCELRYHDIGDYLGREEKLDRIRAFGGIEGIEWQTIIPNAEGDWINQRDPAFDNFLPLGDKGTDADQAVFSIYSLGVATNRDAWAYNMSRAALESNMRHMIRAYNADRQGYAELCAGRPKDQRLEIEGVIDTDPRRISWSHNLKMDLRRDKPLEYQAASVIQSAYRPFCKQWLYFNRRLNERVYQMPKLFPTPKHQNVVISASGIGGAKGFSSLVSDTIPNLHLHDTGQCFPLYWYEKPEGKAKTQNQMFVDRETPDADDYVRRDAITDWALETFCGHYGDGITKEDIFWYVYGILHSPEYKSRFAANLKKMLPRIPFAQDFHAFRDAGRELGNWHLNYETVPPYPLTEDKKRLVMEDDDYRVDKMRFGKKDRKPDKTVIAYNAHLVLRDIPLEAYDYVVNGKPAIEWIMERYRVTTDKGSGIENDPNTWSEKPRYIVDLVKRIVRVSVESARIVKSLPPLNEAVD